MADLTATKPPANPCCAPERQVSCCEPSAKAECCSHDEGCGCDALPASDVREPVRKRRAVSRR